MFYVTINDLSKKNWASPVAQLVKNPPAMWETWVRSLGWEDPQKGRATHSSIAGLPLWLSCKNLPANAEDLRDVGSIPGSGSAPGKGHGKPLQYFPGESLGQRSLKGYNP